MPKYRKKPVVVEAFCWPTPYDNPALLMPPWLDAAVREGTASIGTDDRVYIKTLEGDMMADFGDYIIQGIKGELYPCKPDIFAATYDRAED